MIAHLPKKQKRKPLVFKLVKKKVVKIEKRAKFCEKKKKSDDVEQASYHS